jgi:hypothetical protein
VPVFLADDFLGEPEFDTHDLPRSTSDGKAIVTLLSERGRRDPGRLDELPAPRSLMAQLDRAAADRS